MMMTMIKNEDLVIRILQKRNFYLHLHRKYSGKQYGTVDIMRNVRPELSWNEIPSGVPGPDCVTHQTPLMRGADTGALVHSARLNPGSFERLYLFIASSVNITIIKVEIGNMVRIYSGKLYIHSDISKNYKHIIIDLLET